MFKNRKNIWKLNSCAAGIFEIGRWQQGNMLCLEIDLKILMLAGIIIAATLILIFSYKLKAKHEKYLASRIYRDQ